MRKSLQMIPYTLYALLIFALSGCGANNATTAGVDGKAPGAGKITANLILPKSAGKTVAYTPAATDYNRLTVTGATIPAATKDFTGASSGAVDVYPGRNLTVTAQTFNAAGTLLFEGATTEVTVDAGVPAAVSITLSAPIVKAENTPCLNCHASTKDSDKSSLVANYKQSGHYSNLGTFPLVNGSTKAGCAGCHGTSHDDLNPAASGRCYTCHNSANTSHDTYLAGTTNNCGKCHITHNFKLATEGCIGCHAIPQNAGAAYVQDNNGVRSVAEEFTKWSHHVTGVALNNAHCAACHLEGKVVSGKVVVDPTKHMVDAKTHLRNSDTDADFAWDPAAPNHSGMDTYCMSCHDANGATSAMSVQIQAYINNKNLAAAGKTASASNPFGDTISNRYDKMQRPAVINVDGQFDTTNNSHHAVKGKRYTGKSSTGSSRVIASPGTLGANTTANLFGTRSTIYDSVNATYGVSEKGTNPAFNALYAPLGTVVPPTAATELGDD